MMLFWKKKLTKEQEQLCLAEEQAATQASESRKAVRDFLSVLEEAVRRSENKLKGPPHA